MKTMFLASLAMALVCAGCFTSGERPFTKKSDQVQSFTFRTRGEPGQHFVAKLDVDGEEREIRGVSPAEYPMEACVLEGKVTKTSGEGTLGFEIVADKAFVGMPEALKKPGSSFRFRYHDNGVEVWSW